MDRSPLLMNQNMCSPFYALVHPDIFAAAKRVCLTEKKTFTD